jgi:hypothetical protein
LVDEKPPAVISGVQQAQPLDLGPPPATIPSTSFTLNRSETSPGETDSQSTPPTRQGRRDWLITVIPSYLKLSREHSSSQGQLKQNTVTVRVSREHSDRQGQ